MADLLPADRPPLPAIPADRGVREALAAMRALARLELLVVDERGAPLAVVHAGDLAAVPPDERWAGPVGALAARLLARHVVVPWDTSVTDALERLGEAGASYLVVTGPGAGAPLLGLVTPADVERTAGLRRAGEAAPAAATAS